MRFAVLEGGEACGPFGNQGVALGGGKGHELAMVVGVAAAPASEIGAVKERCEAGGGRGPAAGCGDDEQNNQVKTVHFQDGGGRKHGGNWKRI